MMDIQKHLIAAPANFIYQDKADSFAVDLILELLNTSVKENKIICLSDIRLKHAEYCMKNARLSSGYSYHKEDDGSEKWRRARTVKEWINYYSHPTAPLAWFKRNLGEAILRGKVLALPIIDTTSKKYELIKDQTF